MIDRSEDLGQKRKTVEILQLQIYDMWSFHNDKRGGREVPCSSQCKKTNWILEKAVASAENTMAEEHTFSKLRFTPYINSGINDCAVCERGSPITVHIPII